MRSCAAPSSASDPESQSEPSLESPPPLRGVGFGCAFDFGIFNEVGMALEYEDIGIGAYTGNPGDEELGKGDMGVPTG